MEPGNDKYRLLIENLPDAFAYHQVVTNSEGKPVDYIFLDVNQAFEEMNGLNRDKILGKKVKEVCQENGTLNFDWIGTYGQVALTGESIRFEQYLETAGRWYDITAYSNEPGYFITLFRDITESKQTEQTLQEREAKYRNLVENINEVVYILDENANITYVSPSVESVSGYTPSELIKMRFTDIVHPDDLEGRIEQFLKVMSGVNETSEYRFITKDGRTVWVRTAARPVVKEGRVVGVQGVLTDITERKQAEEELKIKGEYLRGILESQNDLIVRVDLEYRFTYVNDAYCKTFGKTREELIGRSFTPLVHEEDIEHTLKAMEKLFVPPYRAYFEQRAMTIDGWRWIAWDDSGILNDKGEVVEIQAVGRDITEQKQAEQALIEKEKQQELLLDNIETQVWYLNDVETYGSVNQAHADFLGVKKEALQNKSLYELMATREEADTCIAGNKEVFTKKQKIYSEEWVQNGKGEVRLLSITKTPKLDRNNNVEYVVCSAEDITERRQEKEALEESRNLLNSVFQSIQDGISILNTDLTIRDVNQTMERWYGHASPIIGKKCYKVYQNRSEPCDPCPSIRALERKTKCSDIVSFMRENKQVGWLEIFSYPMIDQKTGTVKGIVEFARDITDRKLAEDRIQYLSFHDQLTGLYNRHFMEEEMKRLDTTRQLPLSIIMADLNGLKLTNDTYGHEVGDDMLKKAASVLRESCRKEDIIALWGGDEFIILLPQTTEEAAWSLCRRIVEASSNTYIYDIPLSMALGVASKSDLEKGLKATLKEAEDNMYKQKLAHIRSHKSNILKTLLKTLEEKSYETEAHTQGMRKVAKKIGEKLNLTDTELSRLDLLITLHDIGKINIPEEILTKEGPLTAIEWDLIKEHPEIGFRIARATEEFAHVAEDILAHHEHWDGSGYPQGLKGENIPLLARITAIADAFEVMSRGRPYKKALPLEEIKSEFKRCAGTQFDPELVEAFLSILETGNNFGTQ